MLFNINFNDNHIQKQGEMLPTDYHQQQEYTGLDDLIKKIYLETYGESSELKHTEEGSLCSKEEVKSIVNFLEEQVKSKENLHSIQVQKQKMKICLRKMNEKQSIELRKWLIGAINFNIFTTADKNEAYSSKYAHFLVLLYLTLLQIKITLRSSHRVEALMKYILKQLQKTGIKKEIKQKIYYEFLTLVLSKDQPIKKQNKSQEEEIQQIHSFMRQFMEQERQVATSVFPYYFNLFALVVNKQAIFMDNPSLPLVEYTFEHSQTKRYHQNFTRQDAEQYYKEIQALSANQFRQETE